MKDVVCGAGVEKEAEDGNDVNDEVPVLAAGVKLVLGENVAPRFDPSDDPPLARAGNAGVNGAGVPKVPLLPKPLIEDVGL